MLYVAERKHGGRRPLARSLERSPAITGGYNITLLMGHRVDLVKISDRRSSSVFLRTGPSEDFMVSLQLDVSQFRSECNPALRVADSIMSEGRRQKSESEATVEK